MTNGTKPGRWSLRLLAMVLLLGLFPAINLLVDPFGVFGDPLFHWYGYNETNNPRVAKVAWLEEHKEEFDSYIIGSSCAASYNVKELDRYLDASFYNFFVYGSDARDYRAHATYLLENCQVKNLVLSLNFNEANTEDAGGDDIHYWMHPLASGENPALFYLRCAFLHTGYAIDKVSDYRRDTDLPQVFDVFDADTGMYDKRVRDVEKVGDPAVYAAEHGDAFAYAAPPDFQDLPYLDVCMEAVRDIRDLCAEYGVELTVICSPVYSSQLEAYGDEALNRYRTELSKIVDFWDFSDTSISYDSRYFYDASHFRNAVGTMALAQVFGDDSVYRPADFGTYVTAENCAAYLDKLAAQPKEADPASYTADVPVLMYHHFSQEASGEVVRAETFAAHLRALQEAGYTAVSMREMIDFVYNGGSLPEKPVCITMDDGYLSNYEIAMPILAQYGMKATVFAIGSSMGHREFYKETQHRLTPHFGYDEARAMLASGVLDVQSHTYDMHQWAPFESGPAIRTSALPLEGESEAEYAAALAADLERYNQERQAELGEGFCALAYPGGYYNDLTEVLIHQAGIPITLSIRTDSRNVLLRGLPQSLYALCRWNITEQVTPEALLAMVEGES